MISNGMTQQDSARLSATWQDSAPLGATPQKLWLNVHFAFPKVTKIQQPYSATQRNSAQPRATQAIYYIRLSLVEAPCWDWVEEQSPWYKTNL